MAQKVESKQASKQAKASDQPREAPEWRIDDLAHEAGLTVDTIRFYAREGLLPRPERSGRHKIYGPRHLDRLQRIRELQDRRFSLAAIKAILESQVPGIEEIFTGGDRGYTLAELAEVSGMDDDLIGAFRSTGMLPDPTEFGREDYDTTDVAMLEAAADLLAIGVPEEILVELSRIYVHHFTELQQDVSTLLQGLGPVRVDDERLVAMHQTLAVATGRFIPAAERVLHYVHQRTLQRIALERLRINAREGRYMALPDTGTATSSDGEGASRTT
jgi:DNA-binding transcriptional MerR regulator